MNRVKILLGRGIMLQRQVEISLHAMPRQMISPPLSVRVRRSFPSAPSWKKPASARVTFFCILFSSLSLWRLEFAKRRT